MDCRSTVILIAVFLPQMTTSATGTWRHYFRMCQHPGVATATAVVGRPFHHNHQSLRTYTLLQRRSNARRRVSTYPVTSVLKHYVCDANYPSVVMPMKDWPKITGRTRSSLDLW